MLVCPYHPWTYDLNDGALRNAPNMGGNFDASCRSLCPVHTRIIGTHIFVCLDDNPPEDISRLRETMAPRFAPYDLQNTKIAFESEIIENGNWRSEEHTSELQSLMRISYAVFCLKKQKKTNG